MTTVEDTPENRKSCLCPDCPSYPHGCNGEKLYCAASISASACDINANGCLCPGCPVFRDNGLKGNYYCNKALAGESRTAMRKKRSDESNEFYDGIVAIKDMAASGESAVRSMGSLKRWPVRFDDLNFLPAQVSRVPLNGGEPVRTETVVGPAAKRPLRLDAPLMFSGMSYGAVSKTVRLVLAAVAAAMNVGINTGEDMVLPAEAQAARKQLIAQYSTGRYGTTDEMLKNAAAVEIRFGQGAYPGWESLLPASKMVPDVAKLMGLEPGEDALSPARHPDIASVADLKRKVDWLRGLTGGTPIGAKIGCGHVEQDVDGLVEAGVDFIALDGFGGGTGAVEYFVRDNVGLPIIAALPRAHRRLKELGARNRVTLIAAGGLRTSADFAKCIALGADAVAVGTAALIAINCQQYRICHTGLCPTGVTTSNPMLERQIDPHEGVRRLTNFVSLATKEMCGFARICGKGDLHALDASDLAALTVDAARLTGARWMDGK